MPNREASDLCEWCEQYCYPVGFWGDDGEWVGPYAEAICELCHRAITERRRDGWSNPTDTLGVLRKRLEQKTKPNGSRQNEN